MSDLFPLPRAAGAPSPGDTSMRLAFAGLLSVSLLSAGCGGEATVVGETRPAVGLPAANAAAPATPAAAAPAAPARTVAPARNPTPDRTATPRPTPRAMAAGGRADSAEVTARRAVRDRRVALGLAASPSPNPDRTAAVQVLGTDVPLPGLAALARDAMAEAFPSDTPPRLLAGAAPNAPPVVLLGDLPNPADAAGAAEFLAPAEPVAGPEPEDFEISRTGAVRLDAAALLEGWLTEANAPTPAAVLTLRTPSAGSSGNGDGGMSDEERERLASMASSTGGSDNPFGGNPYDNSENDRPTPAPPSPATTAEAVRRDAFALGPDGDPGTPDTRTAGWTVLVLPRPDEAPAARDADGSDRPNRRPERSPDLADAVDAAAEEGPTAFLIVAGPVEDPAAWLSAARTHLPQRAAAATFPQPPSGDAGLPNVLAATAETAAGPRTLPAPADGDAVGWAFDLTARQNASGDGAADAAPAPGEEPRVWALRAIESGSPQAQRTAARFLSAVAPAPRSEVSDAPAPEGAEEVRTALLAAMPAPPEDEPPAEGPPSGSESPFGGSPSEGGGEFVGSDYEGSGGGFEPALLGALLRWSSTPEHYAAAGKAAAGAGSPQTSTVTTVLERIHDDPAAAAALTPLADVTGAGDRVVAALRQPGAPAEAAAAALLGSETLEVRRAATTLLAEVGTVAVADSLSDAARIERDRDLAKEMRAARREALQRGGN
ncbi:hypothetical protein [Alienimonas californiensis]|uniref:Uncharacterized protein n=1 Tax=Alienimonas californiensis TaxID=2527989 RepID=A0A517P5D8_9PLAN|nr:hypothetical protein [Alienimonas californiensis]QDT14593.1 hypothetical protein CA12_06680 [Alienimonas californiensis]